MIIARGRIVAKGSIDELGPPLAGATSTSRSAAPAATGSRPTRPPRARPRTATLRLLVDARPTSMAPRRGQAAGEIRRFSFELPRLSELFMEAVADAATARRPGDEPLALIGSSPNGDPRTRPLPRVHPLGSLHDLLVVGSFACRRCSSPTRGHRPGHRPAGAAGPRAVARRERQGVRCDGRADAVPGPRQRRSGPQGRQDRGASRRPGRSVRAGEIVVKDRPTTGSGVASEARYVDLRQSSLLTDAGVPRPTSSRRRSRRVVSLDPRPRPTRAASCSRTSGSSSSSSASSRSDSPS